MNNETVYIKGRVVGSFAGTLGSKGKKIHLISGDIVDVDDSFIIESIEPEKVTIPQFVADWIEECKNDDFHLFGAMEAISLNRKKLDYWFREDDNMELFARAWLDGYTVEEKRYLVRVKGIDGYGRYLNKASSSKRYCFASEIERYGYITKHTRKELEEADFGWVFDCEGIEIEEVTE